MGSSRYSEITIDEEKFLICSGVNVCHERKECFHSVPHRSHVGTQGVSICTDKCRGEIIPCVPCDLLLVKRKLEPKKRKLGKMKKLEPKKKKKESIYEDLRS